MLLVFMWNILKNIIKYIWVSLEDRLVVVELEFVQSINFAKIQACNSVDSQHCGVAVA
jgi:hypothetical protein